MPWVYNPFTSKLDWIKPDSEIEDLARDVDRTVEEIEDIARGVAGAGMQYSEVNTFADLPAVADNVGKICVVKTATGVWPINRKRRGLYRSNGAKWIR